MAVVRVANFAEQGIEGITVTATVTELIDASSGLPPNVVTQTVETSAAGYVAHASPYFGCGKPQTLVLRIRKPGFAGFYECGGIGEQPVR